MKIALFGASADPPTLAHQAILIWLAQRYERVAAWAADNPFKPEQSPLSTRRALLQALVADLGYPQVQVYPELGERRSLLSLKRAKKRWGEAAEYHLVAGSDLVSQIPRWYQAPALLSATTLIIFPRPGYPPQSEALETLTKLGGRYRWLDAEIPAISSSDYRQTHNPALVPPAVLDYIQRHRLYHFSGHDRPRP